MVASPGSDNLTGLIVVFVLYMAMLVCAGLVGWWKQRKRMQKAKALENAEEELATQFLAGRSLGPFVTTMTMASKRTRSGAAFCPWRNWL